MTRLKILHPMGNKLYNRAKIYAYQQGLTKESDMIYFDMVVNAFLAGYKSALRKSREDKK